MTNRFCFYNLNNLLHQPILPLSYPLFPSHLFFKTFSGYPFQASRFAQRLSTAIRGTDELRCWNFVVRTTLYLLRNACCVIPPDSYRDHNYIVKDIRNRVAVVRSTFAKHSPEGHSLLCNISASRFAQRLYTAIRGIFELSCWNCVMEKSKILFLMRSCYFIIITSKTFATELLSSEGNSLKNYH